jgi:hypothetical protein
MIVPAARGGTRIGVRWSGWSCERVAPGRAVGTGLVGRRGGGERSGQQVEVASFDGVESDFLGGSGISDGLDRLVGPTVAVSSRTVGSLVETRSNLDHATRPTDRWGYGRRMVSGASYAHDGAG